MIPRCKPNSAADPRRHRLPSVSDRVRISCSVRQEERLQVVEKAAAEVGRPPPPRCCRSAGRARPRARAARQRRPGRPVRASKVARRIPRRGAGRSARTRTAGLRRDLPRLGAPASPGVRRPPGRRRMLAPHRALDPGAVRQRELAVCAGADAEVVAEAPVVQVVAALASGSRIRRDLVLHVARRREARLAGSCISAGDVVVGQARRRSRWQTACPARA